MWGIECVMLQVWYAGFIVTVLSLAKLSGTVFYERGHHGHHGPSLHALTERLADNFATTSATDRSQKCHLDRTAELQSSESFWHWSHKSTLCQSSNFRLQTVWDGPSELHSIASLPAIFVFPVEEAFWLEETSHRLSASSRQTTADSLDKNSPSILSISLFGFLAATYHRLRWSHWKYLQIIMLFFGPSALPWFSLSSLSIACRIALMWYDRYRPKSSVPGHWRKEVHLACLASQRYKGWQRHNERDDINVTTSHWTWQRNIALTTLNCNRQNLKVSSALLCTLLLQLQHAWSLGWFLPFEAQKSWDFLWSSMIRKPGSTCFFSLQFFTSAFNVNVTWSAFSPQLFSTQEIRIYLNLRRRADHEIALPAAVDLDGCFAYPSGRREDADRHVQTCNTNRFLSISPTEWEGMKASNELEATQNAWRCFTAREWHPLWLMFTAWPSPPGGIW